MQDLLTLDLNLIRKWALHPYVFSHRRPAVVVWAFRCYPTCQSRCYLCYYLHSSLKDKSSTGEPSMQLSVLPNPLRHYHRRLLGSRTLAKVQTGLNPCYRECEARDCWTSLRCSRLHQGAISPFWGFQSVLRSQWLERKYVGVRSLDCLELKGSCPWIDWAVSFG